MSESQAELDNQRAADEDPDYWADQPDVLPYTEDGIVPCPTCGGTGYIEATYKDIYQGLVPIEKVCRSCGGFGKVGPVEARALANRGKKRARK